MAEVELNFHEPWSAGPELERQAQDDEDVTRALSKTYLTYSRECFDTTNWFLSSKFLESL